MDSYVVSAGTGNVLFRWFQSPAVPHNVQQVATHQDGMMGSKSTIFLISYFCSGLLVVPATYDITALVTAAPSVQFKISH